MKLYFRYSKLRMHYCFLDLETTGFDADKDSIIEISFIIRDEIGQELDRFDEVLVPDKSPLTPFITHITGITDEEIRTSGKPFSELIDQINDKIGDSIIVGHNIDFDIGFLLANGITVQDNPRIDTHELARIALVNETSYSLEVLSEKYGFTHTDAHRAMSDVEASIELFTLLKQNITALPPAFLDEVRPFLQNEKHDWFAASLFLESEGDEGFSWERPPLPAWDGDFALESSYTKHLDELSAASPILVEQGESMAARDFLVQTAQHLAKQSKKVLVVSPKLAFFPSVRKVPTPEVLFAPEKLPAFIDERTELTHGEVTFVLKCMFRHFLGLRGMYDFDLFFLERKYWNEVNVRADDHPVFVQALADRMNDGILAASPAALFRFREHELFQDRVLLIDEGEVFTRELLFAPAEKVSLFPYLDNQDENVSIATQFFVKNVCQQIIEAKLQHAMTPFPQKVKLHKGDHYPDLTEQVRVIGTDETLTKLAEIIGKPSEKATRWLEYFPESGNLNANIWHPDDWRKIKNDLAQMPKVILHRHHVNESNQFFRVFLGVAADQATMYVDDRLKLQKKLTIPENLKSANSPEFNDFCAEKIREIAEERVGEDHYVVANFSSQETLRKVFSDLSEYFLERDVEVLGEKMTGGDNKLLQMLAHKNKALLLTQKLLTPRLAEFPFKTIIAQKFPFFGPHPLLQEIEDVMKQSGQNFWEAWTVPHVTANLSRRISVYPQADEVIWLDPRENSRWGKGILKSLFQKNHK